MIIFVGTYQHHTYSLQKAQEVFVINMGSCKQEIDMGYRTHIKYTAD